METSLPSKPQSQKYRPELVRLVRLTPWRKLVRALLVGVIRIVVALLTRTRVVGRENLQRSGPLLAVSNHLGDADLIVGMAVSPAPTDPIAKIELYDIPILGKLAHAYGVIWIHRGQPDRRALRAALDALKEGRIVALAPEGRESLTGQLEEGTQGAAFLALKAGAPIMPVTFTGTENRRVYANLKRFRRTVITMTIGKPFYLENLPDHHQALEQGTLKIMKALAAQLPDEYRGVFR